MTNLARTQKKVMKQAEKQKPSHAEKRCPWQRTFKRQHIWEAHKNARLYDAEN